MGWGSNLLLIGFCISFALYVGSERLTEDSGLPRYAPEYMTNTNNLTNDTSAAVWDNVVNSFTSVEAVAVITAGALISSQSVMFTIPAIAIVGAANYFLFPMASLESVGWPSDLIMIVKGLMNLVLILFLYGFIRGVQP